MYTLPLGLRLAISVRNLLLAVDFLVVSSIFLRWTFSGSTGLAEWIYHINRIDAADQIPLAVANFVIFLALLLAATACSVWLTGPRSSMRATERIPTDTVPGAVH